MSHVLPTLVVHITKETKGKKGIYARSGGACVYVRRGSSTYVFRCQRPRRAFSCRVALRICKGKSIWSYVQQCFSDCTSSWLKIRLVAAFWSWFEDAILGSKVAVTRRVLVWSKNQHFWGGEWKSCDLVFATRKVQLPGGFWFQKAIMCLFQNLKIQAKPSRIIVFSMFSRCSFWKQLWTNSVLIEWLVH